MFLKLYFKRNRMLRSHLIIKRLLGLVSVLGFMFFIITAHAQEQGYSYKNDGRRDPFVPLISQAGYLMNVETDDKAVMRLEGIMYDQKGDSMAIVNGQLVKVGETVSDSVISAIEPDKITVIKDNQKIEIPLRKGE